MASVASQSTQPFVRDKLTWLGYLLLAHTTFTAAALGPLMPFLRSELALNYTVAAYHFSAWATGSLLAGFFGDKVIRKLGRAGAMWGCGAFVSVGICILLSAHNPVFTVLGVLLAGSCSSTMGQAVTSYMADRFGSDRTLAISEINILASICSAVAPLLVSCFVKSGMNWRATMVLPIMAFLCVALFFREVRVPPNRPRSITSQHGNLPLSYWCFWLAIMMSVASEWSIVFWSPEFMEHINSVPKADAAQAVAVFQTAMFVARIVGRRLAQSVELRLLLPISSVIALAGFSLFWLGKPAAVSLCGLFITGLGIGNVYPMSLSAAIGTAPDNATTATVRMSLSSGFAILSAPLLLGYIADRSSMFEAYGCVLVLLSLAAIIVVVATQFAQRQERAALVVEPAEAPGAQ